MEGIKPQCHGPVWAAHHTLIRWPEYVSGRTVLYVGWSWMRWAEYVSGRTVLYVGFRGGWLSVSFCL